MDRETAIGILNLVAEKYKGTKMEALFIVGVLCQLGGTSQNCDGNLSYPYKTNKPTLKEIKTIFKMKGEKKGIRKFARKFGTDIHALMYQAGIHGNLAKKIQKNHRGILPTHRKSGCLTFLSSRIRCQLIFGY